MLSLDVWLEASAQPIGSLFADDYGAIAFTYRPEWLGARGNHPLSLSLPLREEPFGDAPTRAFFDNLLQENDQLRRVMEREGLGRDNVAGLLAHVGADCAGAVSVLPRHHPPVKRPGDLAQDYDALSEEALQDIVERLVSGRPLPEELQDPSPLAGYRRKICVAALPGNRFGLPRLGTGAPTTHILKVPDERHPHEARDEAFVTTLAKQCGLDAGSCIAGEIGGQDVLFIRRFDRRIEGTAVSRIHQEDFAQAAGLPATLKYERDGAGERRFGAETIGRILAATAQPALARELFLRATLFNLLIGNNDNHAKNHALIHAPGQAPLLAPFYDLVPVQVAPGFKKDLSFAIGQARFGDDVTADDLEHFCREIGIPASGARRIVERIARDLLEKMERLSQDFPQHMAALDRLTGDTSAHLDAVLGLGMTLRQRDAHVLSGGGWLTS